MSADWYAKKLAGLRGPAAPAPPQYPPTTPPGQLPAHLAPYAQPPVDPRYAAQPQPGNGQYGPQGTPQAAPTQPSGQQFTTYDANTGAAVADDGHVALLVNSVAQTGGSNVVKNNSTACPNCGGGNYFTIQEGAVFSKATGGRVMAMQCADCNYPQVQAGSTGGALQSARSGGPARAARQLPAGHRVSVVGEGGQQLTFAPPGGR